MSYEKIVGGEEPPGFIHCACREAKLAPLFTRAEVNPPVNCFVAGLMVQMADSTKASLVGGVTGVEPGEAVRFLYQQL